MLGNERMFMHVDLREDRGTAPDRLGSPLSERLASQLMIWCDQNTHSNARAKLGINISCSTSSIMSSNTTSAISGRSEGSDISDGVRLWCPPTLAILSRRATSKTCRRVSSNDLFQPGGLDPSTLTIWRAISPMMLAGGSSPGA